METINGGTFNIDFFELDKRTQKKIWCREVKWL